MSSAILYLAIVAIWACFLVPAWVKRPHATAGHAAEAGSEDWFDAEPDDEAMADALAGEGAENARLASRATDYTDATADYLTDTETDVERGRRADVHAGVSRRRMYRDDRSGQTAGPASRRVRTNSTPDYGADDADGYDADGYEPTDLADTWQAYVRPSPSRAQMLRARRRMLLILLAMTAVTGAFAYLRVVGWWICVPPAGMLVMYVLLLREIAQADAELASRRHAWVLREARAEATRQRAYHERARGSAGVTATAGRGARPDSKWVGPTAQIIDISGRVGDQLYDQYADAAVRAVGD